MSLPRGWCTQCRKKHAVKDDKLVPHPPRGRKMQGKFCSGGGKAPAPSHIDVLRQGAA